jgi:hypothetical protein
MAKEMIKLPVHLGLPRAVFLEAGIPLWGVFNEVEPGLVRGAKSANVMSMPSSPDVFLDIARIREPFDGKFALGERALRWLLLTVFISPVWRRRLKSAAWC